MHLDLNLAESAVVEPFFGKGSLEGLKGCTKRIILPLNPGAYNRNATYDSSIKRASCRFEVYKKSLEFP